ncbi:hypothetical protein AB4144_52900, partial [Rhizobiaceae sp. 2RAB30]
DVRRGRRRSHDLEPRRRQRPDGRWRRRRYRRGERRQRRRDFHHGARVRFDRVDPAPFTLDIGTTEQLVLNANGGDDRISATGNLAALIKLIIDGGAGNDTILGGNGADRLLGGDGNDFIDGNQGNDVALLDAGDDTFQW